MSDADYQLAFTEESAKQFKKIDKGIAKRIRNKLLELVEKAHAIEHYPMRGEWKGYYRLRIGDYRAIYSLDTEEKIIEIVAIGHRRDIYEI